MSLEHILLSYEEYERLKTIEKEFHKIRAGKLTLSNNIKGYRCKRQ